MDNTAFPHNPYLIDIPTLIDNAGFFTRIRQLSALGFAPLYYFGTANSLLHCGMAKNAQEIEFLCTRFPAKGAYPALSTDIPAFHIFERELFEEWSILPEAHPWLKPLRFPPDSKVKMSDYPFFNSQSTVLHEVGVGPVHAGVIEPGHFRFICHGESIEHLEIQLGYQHRGIAKLMQSGDIRSKMALAEMIAGDTAIGHGLAYCLAVEALCELQPRQAVQSVRLIALELERIAMHLADLSALSGDIAYLSGLNFFAALRTTVINSSLAICGSRFGKRWLRPGGVNYGISAEQNKLLRNTLDTFETQFNKCSKTLFNDSGVLNRFDSTGSISQQTAQELNLSGITAKACSHGIDARKDFPLRDWIGFEPVCEQSGDVYARAMVRAREIKQSVEMIRYLLSTLPDTGITDSVALPKPQQGKMAISIVEAWRGRIVHVAISAEDGSTESYKIYDPSMHNWFALALAVRGEGISDFPLCNKSFDLSYCGADL